MNLLNFTFKSLFIFTFTFSVSFTLLILIDPLSEDKLNKNSVEFTYTTEDKIRDLMFKSLQIQVQQLVYKTDCDRQLIEQLSEYGKADFPCVIPSKYDHNKQELQKIQWKIEVLEGQLKDETK